MPRPCSRVISPECVSRANAFWIVPTLTPWKLASSPSEGRRSPSRSAPDSMEWMIASETLRSLVMVVQRLSANRLTAVSRISSTSLVSRVPDATSIA